MKIRCFTLTDYASRLIKPRAEDLSLLELRKALGASQAIIAGLFGMTQAYVCMCENGSRKNSGGAERLRQRILASFARELEVLVSPHKQGKGKEFEK